MANGSDGGEGKMTKSAITENFINEPIPEDKAMMQRML